MASLKDLEALPPAERQRLLDEQKAEFLAKHGAVSVIPPAAPRKKRTPPPPKNRFRPWNHPDFNQEDDPK